MPLAPIEKYIETNMLKNMVYITALNQDLNNYTEGGMYQFARSDVVSSTTHKPSDVTYAFMLIVFPYNSDYVIQKLFLDNIVYSRRYYATSPTPWTNWFKFTGTDTGS